jgi:hypothetical protein
MHCRHSHVGSLHYPSQVDILTGWIHHVGYIILLVNLIDKKLTAPFCIMACMEIPTLALSIGHIWKDLRNDLLFGILFFSTRIAFRMSLR